MKAIVSFPKRTNWLKASGVLITCLLFLIPPSCEKPDPDQDSLPVTDEMVATPRAASSSNIMYWGRQSFNGTGGEAGICTSYPEQFGNFVLKVQNVTGGAAKISKLAVRIDGVLVLSAKGINRDYLATTTLRSVFRNCATLSVSMSGDQGCEVQVWIEGTLKLGNVYGRHFYYRPRERMTWNETMWGVPEVRPGYPDMFPGRPYPIIINDARENNFLLTLTEERGFFIGLTDDGHEMRWEWLDRSPCRTVLWNTDICGFPNQDQGCPPNAPIPWDWSDCKIITDFGFNNWDDYNREPNNGGGGCWQTYHRDENVAVVNGRGKWEDVSIEPGAWNENNWDDARHYCVLEWNIIPSAEDIYRIFRQEYQEYNYPWIY